MVKNKGKGGKNRRRGKADGDMKRELTFKEDGQEYAQVTRMLGNGRLEAFCFDGVNRLCHIRGKLRKRVWIGVGDIILLGLREFQDQKADIILKYDGDEARSLKTYGELPDTVQINAGTEMLEGEEFGDDNFDFDECAPPARQPAAPDRREPAARGACAPAVRSRGRRLRRRSRAACTPSASCLVPCHARACVQGRRKPKRPRRRRRHLMTERQPWCGMHARASLCVWWCTARGVGYVSGARRERRAERRLRTGPRTRPGRASV
jgi:translation initiation factor 1A